MTTIEALIQAEEKLHKEYIETCKSYESEYVTIDSIKAMHKAAHLVMCAREAFVKAIELQIKELKESRGVDDEHNY